MCILPPWPTRELVYTDKTEILMFGYTEPCGFKSFRCVSVCTIKFGNFIQGGQSAGGCTC